MILPLVGQRVEVLLNRSAADVWYPGTGLTSGVQLDEAPVGMASWVVAADISDWRPAPGNDTSAERVT